MTEINTVVKKQQIARAFPELRCTFGGRSIVSDIAVFTWERIPVDQNGDIANVFPVYPDWTIEILSPEQRQAKVTKNILHCLKCGCQMSWLIDPEEKAILVFLPNQLPEFLEEKPDQLPVPSWAAGLQLTVGDVFGWLKL